MNNNILFYGNCQIYAILKTLNLSNYIIHHIECFSTTINQEDFTNMIHKCNIIITQPIHDNYRNLDYLSTSYIIKHKRQNCHLIIVDSCYFNFYYYDLTYKQFNNDILHNPSDYHYHKMIDCYHEGHSIDYYIKHVVDNVDLISSEELENIANDSLDEMNKRYLQNQENYKNSTIISIYEFVKQNYKKKLLFYSMNHPTKYVIQFICEQIIKKLNIKNTINMNIDLLDNTKCMIYKCISKNVNFDINQHIPLISTLTKHDEITKLYYDTYKQIGF